MIGHLNVHQHQIIVPGRALAHLVYRNLSVFRRVHLEPAFLEHRHRDLAVEGVILDDQQPFSGEICLFLRLFRSLCRKKRLSQYVAAART